MKALLVDGEVDRVRRLQRDPPATWARTAWGVHTEGGEKLLQEFARVECPNCGETGNWARGRFACSDCELVKRMVG